MPMENPVDEIKRKIGIVEFIGLYIALKKAGRNFKAICPFHQEKTPSFIISPERQIWHCFGACGDGGDIIKFLMKWENITFIEALRELADKAGIKLKRLDIEDRVWQKKERIITLNQWAKDFFQYVLNKTQYGKKAIDYLSSRKIKQEIIKRFEIGYAPSSWDSLSKFLKTKKFAHEESSQAGLLIKSDGGRYYDRFRGRLIFPIKDARSNVIGFSGRTLDPKEKAAKYVNTPETPVYHKRESLYGIDLAKEAIKKEKNAIIVEGEFDMISPFQAGIENIVAIKGSALTYEQLIILKRYTNRVNLALDADSAGEEAIKRGIEEGENLEFEIGIISVAGGKDPDEAVRNDPKKFKESIKKAQPIYDFIINFYQKKYPGDDPFSKKNIAEGVTPFLLKIKNPIVQAYSIKKLAKAVGVEERSIEALIRKQRREKKLPFISKVKPEKQEVSRQIILEKYLLSVIFQNGDPFKLVDKIATVITEADFSIVSHQKIFQLLLNWRDKNNKFSVKDFHQSLPSQLKPVFDEIYLFASIDTGLNQSHQQKIVCEIKKDSLKKKIKQLMADKNSQDQEKTLTELNKRLTELEKSMAKL